MKKYVIALLALICSGTLGFAGDDTDIVDCTLSPVYTVVATVKSAIESATLAAVSASGTVTGTSGTTGAATCGAVKDRQVLEAAMADAADYLATDGTRESSVLTSLVNAIRSYAIENQKEDLIKLSDKEIVITILLAGQKD